MKRKSWAIVISLFALFLNMPLNSFSQENKRYQIPNILQKSYFEVTVGSINYPFSYKQLQPGFQLESVKINRPSIRLVLFGYEFNKYLSAQLTYMRPVLWVKYNYLHADEAAGEVHSRSVWMNVGGLTIKPQLPLLNGKLMIYGEGGLGLITRHGFKDPDGNTVVEDANYSTVMLGSGVLYNLNKKWGFQMVAEYSPKNSKCNQPYTSFIGGGFKYRLQAISDERVNAAKEKNKMHPEQWIQFGLISNSVGYGVNNFVADMSIFWGGNSEVFNGISITYHKNVFHAPKCFALDWGANFSLMQTDVTKENFYALSLFPAFRINFLHSKQLDAYFYYIVAGPTFISKTILDGHDTGKHFTFYDAMATGVFFGNDRQYNAELRIAHYSNGNLFPENGGVKVPLTLNIGYAF